MRDALSNVMTNERTLELEKEKLVDLNEQMANQFTRPRMALSCIGQTGGSVENLSWKVPAQGI